MILKRYNLIPYRDIDAEAFGEDVGFYFSLIKPSRSKIFGDVKEGIIILVPYYFGYITHYLFVREKCRNKGVATALLDSARKYCIRYKKRLTLKIIFNNQFAEALERYALSREMKLGSEQTLHILNTQDVRNATGEKWIYARMMSVSKHFLSEGYKIAAFSKAPKEILSKLKRYSTEKNVKGYETPMDMNPFAFHYDDNLSFICWKENEPVSYICIERFGDSVVVKEFFCFRQYFNLGVSILPQAYFADGLWKDPSVRRVSFMTLDSNTLIQGMLKRQYSMFPLKHKVQKMYRTVAKKQEQL